MVPNRATHHKYDFDDRLPEEESMNLIFLNQVKNFLHANISWKKEEKKNLFVNHFMYYSSYKNIFLEKWKVFRILIRLNQVSD